MKFFIKDFFSEVTKSAVSDVLGSFEIGHPRILDVAGQGGGGSWKFDNIHGRHMRIIAYDICYCIRLVGT